MVKCIINNQATAIIVNIGPYIKEVPEKIIKYCEERNFPLITVPWETHMAHIMQIFCLKITEEDKANMELSSAVKMRSFPTQEDLYIPALERYHYSPGWSYCVAAIEILEGAQPVEKERRQRFQKYIENQLSYRYRDVIIFEQDEEILLIFHQMADEEVKEILQQMMRQYECMLRKEEKSYIELGGVRKHEMYCQELPSGSGRLKAAKEKESEQNSDCIQ